jgi:hypothetical protein
MKNLIEQSKLLSLSAGNQAGNRWLSLNLRLINTDNTESGKAEGCWTWNNPLKSRSSPIKINLENRMNIEIRSCPT